MEIEQPAVPLTEDELKALKADGPKDDKDIIKKIGSVNPIEDFNKMISDRKVDRVQDALSQMRTIVERYVRCSLNGDLYMKALECLRTIREACVKEDEAPTFNQFMAALKDKFAQGAH